MATITNNREYKDRLFNFIFGREENKEWTLSLYNAVNNSDYDDPDQIEFNTLKDVLFMGMRNDTSFLISNIMSVYEHQSSYNRNMPLRMLEYVGNLYSAYIAKNKLNKYGSQLIKLPTPKLMVFYNGIDETPDDYVLKLSDAFDEDTRAEADIDVKVRMINVNYGKNTELMEACRPPYEYSWFINEIRNQQKNAELITAVKAALSAMPDDFRIKEFLVVHKEEVEGMLDTEYNESKVMELFKEDGKREGLDEGISGTVSILRSMNVDDKIIVQKLCEQYDLIEKEAEKYL